MRVAVIVVNWNGHRWLRRALQAISGQTRRPDRIIVVDNGSTDGSERIAEEYAGAELIRLGKNTGFAAANNVGIDTAADCEWVALVNNDAFPEPEWLERLVAQANGHKGFHFFASRIVKDDDGITLDSRGDAYHPSGLAWSRGHGRQVREGDGRDEEVFGACAAAAMFNRSAVLSVGGFDSEYFCYFEDVDLSFRLRLAGYRCQYVDSAIVRHVGSASTGRRSDFAVYHGHRNMVWTFFKNMPLLALFAYLPQHLLLNVISVLWFSVRGQGRSILRAKADAIRGLPQVLRKRRRYPLSAHVADVWEKGVLSPYVRRG